MDGIDNYGSSVSAVPFIVEKKGALSGLRFRRMHNKKEV